MSKPGLNLSANADREKRLNRLEENVENLLEAYRGNKKYSREFFYYAINTVFLAMLILTPVLAVIGNPGGAAVLGLLSLVYFVVIMVAKLFTAGYLASIDAEAEVVLHKERNSLERLGGKQGFR